MPVTVRLTGTIGDCYDSEDRELLGSHASRTVSQKWNTRIELANAIFEYLEIFDNRQRRHSSIEMLTLIEDEVLNVSQLTVP